MKDRDNHPTNFDEHLALLMKDPAFRQEWDRLEPEFALYEALIDLRRGKGLTQRELAKRMQASQAEIARLERGHNVTIKTLQRIAKATNTTLKIQFV